MRSNHLYLLIIDVSIVALLLVSTTGNVSALCPTLPLPQAGTAELTVITVVSGSLDTIAVRCAVYDVNEYMRYPPPVESLYHSAGGGYFYSSGSFTLTVPVGGTTIRAGHGFDFMPVVRYVDVQADTTIVLEFELVVDSSEYGLFCGDVHVHLNHGSGYYILEPLDAFRIASAEGLSVINCLDNDNFFSGGPDPCSTDQCIVYMAEEVRSGVWGHYGLLGLNTLVEPFGSNWGELLCAYADLAHDQDGALVLAAHPVSSEDFDEIIVWPGSGIARELPVDAVNGKIDAYELMSYSNCDGGIAMDLWYDLLDCGIKLPVVGGTDALLNQLAQYPAGGYRTYAWTGNDSLQLDRWFDAIRDGRTFATNGPVFNDFRVLGLYAGDSLYVLKGEYLFMVEVEVRSLSPLDRVEIIRNGECIKRIFPDNDPCAVDTMIHIRVSESSWIAARAYGEKDPWLTVGDSTFAHTSPFYVNMEDVRIAEYDAAERLVAWIDALLVLIAEREGWASAADSIDAVDYLEQGRTYYENIMGIACDAGAENVEGGNISVRCIPNPFNSSLRVIVDLHATDYDQSREASVSDYMPVSRAAIYDVAGRLIRDLTPCVGGTMPLILYWDGIDDRGIPVASGLYFFRLVSESVSVTRKIILMK
ncbi:MAG: CehA/McbA family metallohydrolase [Bacteroidales bacterium]|nr:CehA/McbA family metallohydrolase [Candidatus Latescibacterota bacterium]